MSTAIERYEQPLDLIQSIDDLARLSKQVAESNYYGDTRSAQQAAVKLMIARELGLGLTAISTIHLVEGKITLGYQLMIALVKRSDKYQMKFRQRDDECVKIEWFERDDDGAWESVGFSKFDMEDATRAGIKRGNYGKYPVRMLTARAVSDGFNTYAPECAGGALYTENEIEEPAPARRKRSEQAVVQTREIVVDVDPVPAAPAAPTAAETPEDPPEDEPAAGTSIPEQTEAAKLVMKAMTAKQREVVRECVEHLSIPWDAATPFRLVQRFGADATQQDSLLRVLAAAVTPAEAIEGEVPMTSNDEEGAARFQAWIVEQDERRDATAEKLAAAGAYGKNS